MRSPMNTKYKILQLNIIHAPLSFTLRIYKSPNCMNQSNLKPLQSFTLSANRNNPRSAMQEITRGINIFNIPSSHLNTTAQIYLNCYLKE